MQATTTTVDSRDLQRARERSNRQMHQHGLATIEDEHRARVVKQLREERSGFMSAAATSQCAGCGDAFEGATSRLAIGARRAHERRAHGLAR